MKTYFFSFLIFFAIAIQGQNSVGFNANINFAYLKIEGFKDNEFASIDFSQFGTAGLAYRRDLDRNWSFETGINYSRKGAKTELGKTLELFQDTPIELGALIVHRMDYFEVPALFQFKINGNKDAVTPFIFFGPQLSYFSQYEMGIKTHVLVDINLYNQNINISQGTFNRWDMSAVIGAGLLIPLKVGDLNLKASYVHGFTQVLNNPIIDFNIKHRNLRIGIGYYYNF